MGVIGETQEEKDKADNRLCPCTPALEKEIPSQGHCHCGIFCTKEYANSISNATDVKEEVTHSKGFIKEECENILNKSQISALEVEALLEARELGFINFN